MEVAPEYWENPESLKDIYVSTSGGAVSGAQATAAVSSTVSTTPATASLTGAGATLLDPSAAVRNQRTNAIAVSGRGTASTGAAVSTAPETMIPLSAVTSYEFGTTPLGVNHQGLFVASTVSFNLTVGKTLSDAVAYVNGTMREIGVPATIHGSFQGTARAFQQSLEQPAPGRAGRAGGDLYRARHSVRELHPSDHDPLDPAVGRRRRAAGAACSRGSSSASSP